MIEEPPLLTLRRNFARPTTEQLALFQGVATGFVVDCMSGRGALDAGIKPLLGNDAPFCGVAVPCATGPADNLAVFGAMDIARPGDVIVIDTDGFSSTAVIGDLVLGMMKNAGIVAAVTDGYVRDIPGLLEVDLPCYCAGVTPNSPAKSGPGTAGLPITMAGVHIQAGDIILGDRDGVVVVPHAQIDAVSKTLRGVLEAEKQLDAKVKAGLTMPDFARELLDSDRVVEID